MTAEQKWERAIATVLAHEGGLADNPHDPGKITNWGISFRSYPELGEDGIRNLTREQAVEIYRTDWWLPLQCDKIQNPDLAAKVLDLSVNVGKKPGIMLLQRALKAAGVPVVADGVMGPKTLEAANTPDLASVILAALRSEAAGYYRLLIAKNPDLKIFERNWLSRAYD